MAQRKLTAKQERFKNKILEGLEASATVPPIPKDNWQKHQATNKKTGELKMSEKKEESIRVDLQNRVKTIKSMATKLDATDIISCEEQLRKLRCVIHDIEYWLDSSTRELKEKYAWQKVNQLFRNGFKFDSIVVDGVAFCFNNDGKLVKGYGESELPF